MLPFPRIDPVLIKIGPLKIRWYGVMYALGFLASYALMVRQERTRRMGLEGQSLQNLIFYLALGLIIGGRLGYILFYQYANLMFYLRHPLEIIAVWHGGMSFHGGLMGTFVTGTWFCRRHGFPFWEVADSVVVTVPVGLGLGRIGNFINGELFGRPSSLPWAMVFPMGGPLPRHPSQLYEAALEGALLFVILWHLKDRSLRPGTMVCLFFCGYGILRFIAEYLRQPDPHIGLLWGSLTMGQLLCLAMILTAIIIWIIKLREPVNGTHDPTRPDARPNRWS